jgi:alkanesulfonate monooxygenase SsuD/methylene tetrahydromethanopterin reductase-like flavin-dependent oxidoreductase (luciferase family)
VHSLGLKPARVEALESSLEALAPHWPGLDIMVAASGPRVAELAGRRATDLIIGTGLDATAISNLAVRGRAARKAAGIAAPLHVWISVSTCVLENASQLGEARATLRGAVNGGSRYSFSSGFAEKNVPEELQAPMLERLRKYDFGSHAKATDNPNSALFADRPDIQDYLLNRMLLVGTAEQCLTRVRDVAAKARLDGVRLVVSPWPGAGGPIAQLERLVEAGL